MTAKVKNQPGVYKIECLPTGELYIGSSRNLMERKYDHYKKLRNGQQRNKNLLARYQEYGESNIVFTVLAYIPVELRQKYSKKELESILFRLEQAYMDTYQPTLNICPRAGTSEGFKQYDYAIEITREASSKDFSFYNPLLGVVSGKNLSKFSDDNELTRSCLEDVLHGRSFQHKNFYKDEESYLKHFPSKYSVFSNVTWKKNSNQWAVSFTVLKKTLNFGNYDEESEAGMVSQKLSILRKSWGDTEFYEVFTDYQRSKSYSKRQWTLDKLARYFDDLAA